MLELPPSLCIYMDKFCAQYFFRNKCSELTLARNYEYLGIKGYWKSALISALP